MNDRPGCWGSKFGTTKWRTTGIPKFRNYEYKNEETYELFDHFIFELL